MWIAEKERYTANAKFEFWTGTGAELSINIMLGYAPLLKSFCEVVKLYTEITNYN